MNFFTEIKQKLNTQLSDLNTPKFSGAIDVIVIQDENDSLSSTPFYVKFGKIGVTEPTEKTVELKINNKLKAVFKMIFKENGDAEYVLNSFKIIEKEFDLMKCNNKSNNLLDSYFKNTEVFESKMNDLNSYQIKSEPVFYVSDDDEEDLKVLSEWLDESESLFVHKEISNAFQTYSKVFTLTSDQLKGFNLNLGII
jgi:phosphatidate phosphatase PAH1